MELKELIEQFSIDEIKNFVTAVVESEGKATPTKRAQKTHAILFNLLKEKGHIVSHAPQAFVDILLAGALLYDFVWKDSDCWTSVFYARKNWEQIGVNAGLSEQTLNAFFSVIESQLGDHIPVDGMKINPGTPNELFYYSVWFTKYLEEEQGL